jgi:hypothetical protein
VNPDVRSHGAVPASPPPQGGPTLFRRWAAALGLAAGIVLELPLPASARSMPHPVVLTVETVPPIAGVMLTIDGSRSVVSQANGVMVLNVATTGTHTLSLTLPVDDDQTRYVFVRWSDEAFEPVRQVRLHEDHTLSVGLQVSYRTRIVFADPDGHPLDLARVSHVTLSGPDAEIVRLTDLQLPVWLHSPLPAKHMGDDSLHVGAAPYAINTVDYDGLNVASIGQERYVPAPGGTWVVHLRLFRLTLRAKDALFGSSLSQPVTLTSPSGQQQWLRLDRNGQVSIVAGRGNYVARLHALGLVAPIPIALSRNQTADILVVTPIDLAVLASAGLVIVVALFAVGRGRRRLLLKIRHRRPVSVM